MREVGFFRCSCGKLHAIGGLDQSISRCTCGVNLWEWYLQRGGKIKDRVRKLLDRIKGDGTK